MRSFYWSVQNDLEPGWKLTVSTGEKKNTCEKLTLLPWREVASDQVICWAPVINNLSQIQSGMTGKLACSSLHTQSYRSAQ